MNRIEEVSENDVRVKQLVEIENDIRIKIQILQSLGLKLNPL